MESTQEKVDATLRSQRIEPTEIDADQRLELADAMDEGGDEDEEGKEDDGRREQDDMI